MPLTSDWQQRLRAIQRRQYEPSKSQYVISPAQFIFNPLEASEVIINASDQYDPARLTLGEFSQLTVSITSSSLAQLSLFGSAEPIDKGIGIKEPQTYKLSRSLCCVMRTYEGRKPTNDISQWVLLPCLLPSLKRSISLEFSGNSQQVYELGFDVVPDEQGYLAYFGDCGVMPGEAVEIIVGR